MKRCKVFAIASYCKQSIKCLMLNIQHVVYFRHKPNLIKLIYVIFVCNVLKYKVYFKIYQLIAKPLPSTGEINQRLPTWSNLKRVYIN
ncbi:hypothetical protein C0J52_12876 [Blattella germanica]|nr:hypothetical protein C0J52_12876 [Blattella germanica]